jgi:hypothetical protein
MTPRLFSPSQAPRQLRRAARLAPAALGIAILFPPVARAGDEIRRFSRDFPVTDHQSVRLDFPAGDLQVEGTSGDKVEIEVVARCKHHLWGHCEERAKELDLESHSRDDRLDIELVGASRHSNQGLEVKMRVKLPSNRAFDLEMGAGEVEIRGLETNVHVHLGAGEVHVEMDERVVHEVHLDAGVGETTLRSRDGKVEGSREHVVGSSVDWDEGTGKARVQVKVGAGEVQMRCE